MQAKAVPLPALIAPRNRLNSEIAWAPELELETEPEAAEVEAAMVVIFKELMVGQAPAVTVVPVAKGAKPPRMPDGIVITPTLFVVSG